MRSTCFFLKELPGVPDIMIVSDVGRPAMTIRYKVVKILYAILKYPIPWSFKISWSGILQNRPSNLTTRLEAIKTIIPDINLGFEEFLFCKFSYLRFA